MDCLCCFRLKYESPGCDEEGDDLEGAEVAGDVSKGETGLRSPFRGCDGGSFCVSWLNMGEVAGADLCEVRTFLATSGEASSGFAMRRPPSEPDKSRSPFMMEQLPSGRRHERYTFDWPFCPLWPRGLRSQAGLVRRIREGDRPRWGGTSWC